MRIAADVLEEVDPKADRSCARSYLGGARHAEFGVEVVRSVHAVVDDIGLDDGRNRVADQSWFRRDEAVTIERHKRRCCSHQISSMRHSGSST